MSVPVLSSRRPDTGEVLERLAALDRTPRRAAAPIAETTATGIEITSEHGQATISSASAAVEPGRAVGAERDGTVASASAAANTSGV